MSEQFGPGTLPGPELSFYNSREPRRWWARHPRRDLPVKMQLRSVMIPFVVLCMPEVATAQLPGGAIVGPGRNAYEYAQRMQIDLAGYLRAWERSWDSESDPPLRDHYESDALVVQPNGRFVQGQEKVTKFADTMSELSAEAFTSMTDFEASEGIAYTWGPYAIVPREGDGTADAGSLLSILFRDNDRWRIRTQVFLHETGPVFSAHVGSEHLPPFALPAGVDADARTRYANAVSLLAAFRTAWNGRNAQRAAGLLSPSALLLLPGAADAVRADAAVTSLETFLADAGTLTTAILDFDARARVAYLLGRYHLSGAHGGTGTFVIVLAQTGGDAQVRAVLFR